MNQTILLVDDEADIRDVLKISLMDIGYDVVEADNGEAALRLFQQINPPIVMTDIKMPGMDGIDLLQRIKQENPETEVIMITGHGDMDLAVLSLKHEATDFITKPINVEALEISVRRARDKIVLREQLKAYTESLETLIREKTELQDHLSTLGLLIGTVSHNIKGLLTGLDGGMYLIESGLSSKNPKDVEDGCKDVKLMVGRIRKMVLDILFYAKERDLESETVDAAMFAEEIAVEMESKVKDRNIDFARDFDSSSGEFEIDTGRIHSALFSLFENAIDACEKDDKPEPGKIVFSVKGNTKNIIFNVSDNGIGMDRETREKIFTLFFSTKGTKGTGLGLFIADKIVRQHGGSIHVESAVGRGSRFVIRIPKNLPHTAKTVR
jgi:signal transduction histidine kinase